MSKSIVHQETAQIESGVLVTMYTQMSKEVAQAKTDYIRGAIDQIGGILLEIKQRRGWAALGYKSFTAYLAGEYRFSRKHLYELMDAAPVQEKLSPKGYKLNLKQAKALSAFSPDLWEPIVRATQVSGKITEGRLKAVGEVFKDAVTTGYANVGEGDSPTALDAAIATADRILFDAHRDHMTLDSNWERAREIECNSLYELVRSLAGELNATTGITVAVFGEMPLKDMRRTKAIIYVQKESAPASVKTDVTEALPEQ